MSASEIVARSQDPYNYIDTVRAGECLKAFMTLSARSEPLINFAKLSSGFEREAQAHIIKRAAIIEEMIARGILSNEKDD